MTQTTKVAFKNDTKENQAARIEANHEHQLQIIADAGLENPVILHGYIGAFKVKENLTAKNGKPGKHYVVNVYANDKDNWFHIYTYAPGYIEYYDKLVALKERDKQTKARKLSGTVLAGTNPKSKSNRLNVAAVFIDNNKR